MNRPQSYAAWYETAWGGWVERTEWEAMDALAAPRAGERALDAGCGPGRYTRHLARLGLDAVGVDRDRDFLTLAGEAAANHLSFRQADCARLPFPDGSFDLAVTLFCLEFVADPGAVVAELVRVLAPGGRLVVATLHRRSLWGCRRLARVASGRSRFPPRQLFTAAELQGLLAIHGLVHLGHALRAPPWPLPPPLAALADRLGRPFCPGGVLLARLDRR
ncbi:MAG: class I SAM-dependent methyltransferase [Thermaerobacter sp.]|nr:class I SAM-dependent methyltransferase [Thermaerobacter sp.]